MSTLGAMIVVAITAFVTTGCGGGGTTAAPVPPGTPATASDFAPTADPAPPPPSPSASAPPLGTSAVPTAPVAAPESCGTDGWGAAPKAAEGFSRASLYLVRIGRHDCYDRVVFDLNGPAPAGFSVRYVPVVTSDPRGEPLPVPGGAVLQVVVRAPGLGDDDSGHQPGRVLARTGDQLYGPAQLAGWPSLRAVRFAGSFESQCTFAVGVRVRLPFRVFTQLDSGDQIRRVVVDIAH
ncbi:hypothetical protein ACFWY9_16310 [Amycolatopsis sp. NPDC059027]|uniref:AMIN-like domain-containing (lipo)protein n=1 Tax=unclassified Amycolatopsis TaxID=2618356 RepID=UPI0036704E86